MNSRNIVRVLYCVTKEENCSLPAMTFRQLHKAAWVCPCKRRILAACLIYRRKVVSNPAGSDWDTVLTHLSEMRISQGPLCFWISNNDTNSRKDLLKDKMNHFGGEARGCTLFYAAINVAFCLPKTPRRFLQKDCWREKMSQRWFLNKGDRNVGHPIKTQLSIT